MVNPLYFLNKQICRQLELYIKIKVSRLQFCWIRVIDLILLMKLIILIHTSFRDDRVQSHLKNVYGCLSIGMLSAALGAYAHLMFGLGEV